MNIDNIIMYLRKSRSDNPEMSVQEVLARHEQQLQEYASKKYGSPIPESQIYREVVSGETIADRPILNSPLDIYVYYAYNIIIRRPQNEIPGNRKNNNSGWMAIQESKRLSLFLHPPNETRKGHNPQPPWRHCSTNSQANFQTSRAVKPGTATQ